MYVSVRHVTRYPPSQHYAALGRDVAGAAEVNLINADQVRPHFLSRTASRKLQHAILKRQ